MKKLTPAMLDLLDSMKNGVRVHYMEFSRCYDAYYFRSDTNKPCTKQVEGLVDRGLIRVAREGHKTSVCLVQNEPPVNDESKA